MIYLWGDLHKWAENLLRYLRNAPAELKAIISNAENNTKESLKMKTKIRMKRIKDQRIGCFEKGVILKLIN